MLCADQIFQNCDGDPNMPYYVSKTSLYKTTLIVLINVCLIVVKEFSAAGSARKPEE